MIEQPESEDIFDGTEPPDAVPVKRQPMDIETRQRLREHHGTQVHWQVPEIIYDHDGLPHAIGTRTESGLLVVHPDLLADDE